MTIYKVLFEKLYPILTLLTMGVFFEAAHGFGGGARKTSSLYLRYPTVMTLGTVVSYPKKIQKIYKSCDTQLNFCWHQHFLIENQQILLYQEIHV